MNLTIKPSLPEPPAPKPVAYDFEGLSNYQPLDLKFSNDDPILSFNPPITKAP
jgi:hypothetical protein